MAATVYPWRRRLAAASGLLLVTSGCGPPGQTDQPAPDSAPPSRPGTATDHSGPDGTASPGHWSPRPTPGAIGLGEGAETYPGTAREYAARTVAAWSSPDLYRLDALATEEVYDAIIGLPGPPDRDWTFIRCSPADGRSDCTFYNRDGDHLALTVAHDRLGDDDATVDVTYDAAGYPNEPAAYAEALFRAWQRGNTGRVTALAVPDAAADLSALPTDLADAALSHRLRRADDETAEVVTSGDGDTDVLVTLRVGRLGDQRAVRAVASPAS